MPVGAPTTDVTSVVSCDAEEERTVQATVVPGSLDFTYDHWSLPHTEMLYTYTSCLKGQGCANLQPACNRTPSPMWHAASKMAVSYFEAVIILNTHFISFWLEQGAHRCGKRPPLAATGAQPCPRGTITSCHLWWDHQARIWRWNLAHAMNFFACPAKENRCVAPSHQGTHCSMGHVTQQAAAGVQPGRQAPNKLLEGYGTTAVCYLAALLCCLLSPQGWEHAKALTTATSGRIAGSSQKVWDCRQMVFSANNHQPESLHASGNP